MALYTIGVYYERQGETVREIVNRDWRMEYQQADQLAAEYTQRYAGIGRRYTAVNVSDLPQWEAQPVKPNEPNATGSGDEDKN
jgi:hypothetical protein